MGAAAVQTQSGVKFGQRPLGATTILEADESRMFSWTEEIDEGGVSIRRHFYYVWVGVLERGDRNKFWLVPVGITHSDGEGRLPPLTNEFWRWCCEQLFNEDTRAILMSDSAHAYASVVHPGIVQKFSVNHFLKEWSKPCTITANVLTGEQVASRVHSQTIDRCWAMVKAQLPRYRSAKTEEERAVLDEYIRAAQWRMQHSTYDLWEPFCKVAVAHAEQSLGEQTVEPHFRAFAAAAPAAPQEKADVAKPGLASQLTSAGALADKDLDGLVAHLSGAELSRLARAIEKRLAAPVASSPDTASGRAGSLKLASEQAWGDRHFQLQGSDARCGMYALNHLIGQPLFTAEALEQSLDRMLADLPYDEDKSNHVRASGWYSHGVLGQALQDTVPPCWIVHEPSCCCHFLAGSGGC